MRSRMSIVPKLFSHWWEALERPHRLMDQHFGMTMHPEQMMSPFFNPPSVFDRRWQTTPYYRPWADLLRDEETGWSVVKADKDKFHVALDVQQFKPEEINVKVVDNFVIVEGKHEEKEDDHGIVSRQFVRKYMVPEQCDAEKTTSSLSSDGILTITTPRKPEAIKDKKEKAIPIEQTGKPAVEERTEAKRAAVKQ